MNQRQDQVGLCWEDVQEHKRIVYEADLWDNLRKLIDTDS